MTMDEKSEQTKSAKINNVLGQFILFFGVVIMIAIFFTETFVGQMTNLVAGLILIMIGVGMIIQSTRKLKNIN
jgi:putative Mn2+ efflux pump MntP